MLLDASLIFPDWTTEDFRVAEGIFGATEPAAIGEVIARWCAREVGEDQIEVFSLHLSVGASLGIALRDGGRILLKAFPRATDPIVLAHQIEIQMALAVRAFPAPRVLWGVRPFGAGHAYVMAFEQDGCLTDVRWPGVRESMARCLARLVTEAAHLQDAPTLPAALPDTGVWPPPHNAYFDFAATSRGAEWIDAIAAASLDVLRRSKGAKVIGHKDWSAKNMRVSPTGEIGIVYDWDSLCLDRETTIVGMAAATFPWTWDLPVARFPTADESGAFVRAYELARGRGFEAAERQEIRATGMYNIAYCARCEHAGDPDGDQLLGSARRTLRHQSRDFSLQT